MHPPKAKRRLAFEAAFTIVIIRLMLQCLPLLSVQRAAMDICAAWRRDGACAVDRITWAVQRAARSIPGSSCLVQALAVQTLLVRYNYKPCLVIGVSKDKSLGFEAHAWVTSEGQIVIGGHEASRYTTILTLGSLS
jgi:Transglutaminase-like superfamily